ncbi:hypothetical protein GM658_02065 [Pseudoduganella eburnea]|uniref:DUF3997 domain-containing protein n=1 Tax=Massilia eburnea TaxID=1776165 RepID=A0A6L6QCC4_9BURK|nr:hypothetical protein [Massilia eburnea]MTW09373.1 hypothetical protein [Massilia eburnea]
MGKQLRWFLVLVMPLFLGGCLFDSGVEWRAGPYALLWIDTSENTSICRDLGNGNWIGRIDGTVFAVGWDGRYLVAKQHPSFDRSQTNYFIIDSANDGEFVDPSSVVIGPLTALEFQRKSTEMKLPKFSKVLESLD